MGKKFEYRNTLKVIRTKKDGSNGGYTCIANKIIQSKELTPIHKTILIYLLSVPEDWSLGKRKLYLQLNTGRDATVNAFDELMNMGYIHCKTGTTKNMLFYNYTVFENPQLSTTGSSTTDSSTTENQYNGTPVDNISKDIKSTILINNNLDSIIKENINTSDNTGPEILGEIQILNLSKVKISTKSVQLKEIIKQKKIDTEFNLSNATIMGNRIIYYLYSRNLYIVENEIGKDKMTEIKPLIDEYFKYSNQW